VAETTDDLSLEMMRVMRAEFAALRDENREIRMRLVRIEEQMIGLRRDRVIDAEAVAQGTARTDRFDERLQRIERRPDLVD